jgi:MFS family permease
VGGQQTSRTPLSRQQALIGGTGLAACAAIGIGMLLTGAAWSGLLAHHEWFWPFSHAVDWTLLVIGLAILAAGAALLTLLWFLAPRLRGVPEAKGNDEH